MSVASTRSKAAKWRALADAALGPAHKDALNDMALMCDSQADRHEAGQVRSRRD